MSIGTILILPIIICVIPGRLIIWKFIRTSGECHTKLMNFLISLSLTTPHVLCLTKHHLWTQQINNLLLGQYTLGAYFCRRIYKQCGVSIYVSNNFQFNIINLDQHTREKDLEICALKLQASINLVVICIYRSPTGNFTYFLNQLELILNKIYNVSTNIILCDDFNLLEPSGFFTYHKV